MCYIFCFPPPIEMFLVTMSGLYYVWFSWGPEEFGLGTAVIAMVQTEYLYKDYWWTNSDLGTHLVSPSYD